MAFFIGASIVLAIACVILAYLLLASRRESFERQRELDEANETVAARASNYHLKLRALSENSGAGLIMLDPNGIVIHTNSTVERILGCAPDSMVGHSLIQATFSNELLDFVKTAAASGKAQANDFTLPGVPPRTLRASVYPFQKGLSGSAETMLVLVDVTELRRLETIRRDFVANVSHELRTPLASIRAMAETLLDGAAEDPQVSERFLSTIIQEADRLARISEDLLILANAESKDPSKEPFRLDELIKQIAGRYELPASEREIELKLQLEEPMVVNGSRDQLEQVLVNLVDNAVKYTQPGGKVTIRSSSDADRVHVEVQDTGIGIMQEHLDRIFERFYRVDKARSRESGGTGLGLSIVKNIIEAHGGEVDVVSEFNHGSTFSISLPKHED